MEKEDHSSRIVYTQDRSPARKFIESLPRLEAKIEAEKDWLQKMKQYLEEVKTNGISTIPLPKRPEWLEKE